MHFLILRTDNIGDLILTLPVLAKLKQYYPDAKITLLARHYTHDIIERAVDIDGFIAIEDLKVMTEEERTAYLKSFNFDVFLPIHPAKDPVIWARQAKIPVRVGHIHRNYMILNSNRLIFRIKRKRCDLHQVQLCLQFLKGLNLPYEMPREEMESLIRLKPVNPSKKVKALLNPKAFNLVIHPGTNGHTLEWPVEHFAALMRLLPANVKVFVTGSPKEEEKYGHLLKNHPNATGLFGTLSLSELTDFLGSVDGVIVGSTGPLHVSAALGTKVIGLFPPQQDLNVQRWGAIGKQVINLEAPHCEISRKKDKNRCGCMVKITPEQVYQVMQEKWGIS